MAPGAGGKLHQLDSLLRALPKRTQAEGRQRNRAAHIALENGVDLNSEDRATSGESRIDRRDLDDLAQEDVIGAGHQRLQAWQNRPMRLREARAGSQKAGQTTQQATSPRHTDRTRDARRRLRSSTAEPPLLLLIYIDMIRSGHAKGVISVRGQREAHIEGFGQRKRKGVTDFGPLLPVR